MRELTPDEAQVVTDLVALIEKIVATQDMNRDHHRDEVEKYFNFILQGEDIINPYQRRQVGIDDSLWKESIKKALLFLNLKKNYDKIFKE